MMDPLYFASMMVKMGKADGEVVEQRIPPAMCYGLLCRL